MLRYNFPKLPGIFEGHRTYNSAPEADYWDTTVVDNELLIRWTGHYGPGNSPEHYTILELYPVDGRKVLGKKFPGIFCILLIEKSCCKEFCLFRKIF